MSAEVLEGRTEDAVEEAEEIEVGPAGVNAEGITGNGMHWSEDQFFECYVSYTCANCDYVEVRYFSEDDGAGPAAWDAGRQSCARCGIGMIGVKPIRQSDFVKYRRDGATIRFYEELDR